MVDRDPVRVGVLFSHTGVTSTIGLSQLHGALLAIDEINEAGGINGRELVAVQYDAQSNPQRYAQLAEQLIVQDKVNVIFGCQYVFRRMEQLQAPQSDLCFPSVIGL